MNDNHKNVTNLISSISRRYEMPCSTLRWNLKCLTNLGLIKTGNSKNKGLPVRLTDYGLFVCQIIKSEQKRDRS